MTSAPQFGRRATVVARASTPPPAKKPLPKENDAYLKLGSNYSIARAYSLAPQAGVAAMWLLSQLSIQLHNIGAPPLPAWRAELGGDLSLITLLLPMVIFGPLWVIIEMVFVTPLLLAFRRYGWSWVSTWSICAIGFFIGALPALIVAMNGTGPAARSLTESLASAGGAGVGGIVGALVFRLLAFRRIDLGLIAEL